MLIQKNVNQNLEVYLYLYYQNLGWKNVDRLWESELEDISLPTCDDIKGNILLLFVNININRYFI